MPFYKRLSFWFLTGVVFLAAFFILRKTFNAVEVKVLPVKRQGFVITVTATSTGTIKSDREVKITAQRIGEISRLLVEEGDVVKPGSTIAELDTNEVYLNLQVAQASLDRARAVLKEVEARLKRFNELKEKGYAAQLDIDSIHREDDVADATAKEARNSLSIAKLNYDYSFIKSPISGVITSRPVKLGETVMKGSLVVSVVSTEDLYIEAFVDEADVAKVRLGQEVNVTMDAYQGKAFKGSVYMISPVVLGGKQETRTFEVRTRLREKGIIVKPGMSADIEIIVDNAEDALIVPSQAVIERDSRKGVFIKKDSHAMFVQVETGRFNWISTEILSGLKEGDIVIINPDVYGIAEGKRVKEGKNLK